MMEKYEGRSFFRSVVIFLAFLTVIFLSCIGSRAGRQMSKPRSFRCTKYCAMLA